jgi:hypothetical protein
MITFEELLKQIPAPELFSRKKMGIFLVASLDLRVVAWRWNGACP